MSCPRRSALHSPRLVYGLVHPPSTRHPRAAAKLREITLDWSRYDYRGPILEAETVSEVLERARRARYRYVFVQFTGHVITERGGTGTFVAALETWADARRFLVAGAIVGDSDSWYGLDRRYLLIDLHRYDDAGAPALDAGEPGPRTLPRVDVGRSDRAILRLVPSAAVEQVVAARFGSMAIARSLEMGLEVSSLAELLGARSLSLAANDEELEAFAPYLGEGLSAFAPDEPTPRLTDDQRRFLTSMRKQASNARRGVFLTNVEPYDDVPFDVPAGTPPLEALYSVAAGFKPNMILHRHGFDDGTRIVFFDYSAVALDCRRTMVERWDGRDLPSFSLELLARHPPDRAFYQQWPRLSAAALRERLREAWSLELDQWGGEDAFAAHWRRYRRLAHEFVLADVLEDATPLLERVESARWAAMWWSNAFFTMYGNWRLESAQRRVRYESWTATLAARCPDLQLYGSDSSNVSVNAVRALDYWRRYCAGERNPLRPEPINRMDIRT